MGRLGEGDGMRIGEVLKSTRTRQGLDIRTVEERTKIRIKYLRALESEDWQVLPSPAYAKGFLRTYASLLGLDAEAIVDEFRRQVESQMPSQPFGEPVLASPRQPMGEPRRLGGIGFAVLAVIGVLVVLLVIGLVGGDGGDETVPRGDRAERREQRQERQRERRQRERRQERRQEAAEAEAEQITLNLELTSDVQVCLVSGAGDALIDDQLLSAGSEERFEAKTFGLRFPSGYDRGQFVLSLNGKRTRVPETQGPTAFEITGPAKLEQVEFESGCP
jgi:cytoskeletal protein RodZ